MGLLLLGVVLGAGLGAGGVLLLDDEEEPAVIAAADPSTTTAPAPGPLRFEADDVPFTFEYPATFAPVAPAQLPAGYVAILGISPINFLDVRRTAETELTDAEITGELAASLEAPGVAVNSTATRAVGSATVHVFEVTDRRTEPATESRLHFFRAGGRTWELACQSDAEGRPTIEDACDGMLETLDVAT